jgi:hypothetical protein
MTTRNGGSDGVPMFSRAEIERGLPARRASGVVFAIEAQTARLVASSRVTRATFVGERGSAEREQAFLQAMAAGRDLPVRPTIQDLERFAPQWAELVPDGVEARAAVAALLAAKYRLVRDRMPRIRAVLGLDTTAVAEAVARQLGPGRGLYVEAPSVGERLAWRRAAFGQRVEALPPFWIAYALALTETIGEGILVVPIAVAAIGPAAGVVVLLALGAVNLITLGAMVEAITRNGSMRYGSAYFGRLVHDLLGRTGSVSLSLALLIFNAVVLLVYLLGFASVLTGATGVPEGVWVALLFAVNVFYLRRESLDETVASAVVIGAVNIGLVVAITALAFTEMDPANLGYVNLPFVNGQPFDPLIVQLVFGVVIVAYFGHTSAANASKLILGRDPSGRSLLWGNLAALSTVIVLYCFAVVAFAGVLGPSVADTRGTAITPLANEVGPIIDVLGSIYVVLAIGLGSIYVSLGLYNQVVELLPTAATRSPDAGPIGRFATTRRGRLLIGLSPVVVITISLELLLATNQDWFAGPLGYVGVLTVPLLGGIFPMLMVLAARRRGEYMPGAVIAFLGRPVTVVAISALFLTGVLIHGLVIWDGPLERALAIGVAIAMAVVTIQIVRSGAFRGQTVVELRDAEPGGSHQPGFSIISRGRPMNAEVVLDYGGRRDERTGHAGDLPSFVGLGRATVTLPRDHAGSVRVWVHRITASGESLELPARVEVAEGQARVDIHLVPEGGPAA